MEKNHAIQFARVNPVKAGIFAVLGVIALGTASGFALDYDLPEKVAAQIVTVTPVTVVAPPAPTPTPVIVPVVPVVPPTPVAPVVVTPSTPSNQDTPPPPADTTVTPVVVTPEPADNDDPFGPPCCTETPPPPPPPVDDPFGPPCCTETPPITPDVVTVTPPVTPPVVPPTPPVRPPESVAECVFLTGTPNRITPGQAVTLAWETRNATSISIDNGVGTVTPTAAGSVVVYPTRDTTYTATVTGANGSVNCRTSVVVSDTEAPAQCVFLTGSPNVIKRGDSVRLTWETRNATGASLNEGIGEVAVNGSITVNPTRNTTYVLTVRGAQGSVNCQTTVVLTTIEQDSQCVFLEVNGRKSVEIDEGDSVRLEWDTNNADRVSLNQGIGEVDRDGSMTVRPDRDTEYRLSVDGRVDEDCIVTVRVEDDDNPGGGGGGGGRRSARVGLESYVPNLEEPLSFVYLSETPYTGLELGTWGTVLYWLMLIGWSAALAYLVLFNAVPFALSRAKSFGSDVKTALNGDAGHGSHGSHDDVHGHAAAHAAPAHASSHGSHGAAHDSHAHSVHAAPAPAKPAGFDAHDGFRSFQAGAGLTIDDIVKGLSRQIELDHEEAPAAPVHQDLFEEQPAPAPAYVPQASAAPAAAPAAAKAAPAAAPMNDSVRDFLKALLDGDRDTVFGMIRTKARQGEDTELFVSHAACALDDAYRACIDGTTCHPDIAELTANCHPSFLEKLVSSLTTAVDGSYSAGMTGVKMALTRALGVVAG